MASLRDHVYLCEEDIGYGAEEAHRSMDQFAGKGPIHRQEIHHWEGIKRTARDLRRRKGKPLTHWKKACIHHVAIDMRRRFDWAGNKEYQFPIPHEEDYNDDWWPDSEPWFPVDLDDDLIVTTSEVDNPVSWAKNNKV